MVIRNIWIVLKMSDDKDCSLKEYNLTLGFDWIKWGGDGVGIYAEEEYDSTGHMMKNPFIKKMGTYEGSEIQKDFIVYDKEDIDTLREQIIEDILQYCKDNFRTHDDEPLAYECKGYLVELEWIINKRFGVE